MLSSNEIELHNKPLLSTAVITAKIAKGSYIKIIRNIYCTYQLCYSLQLSVVIKQKDTLT